MKLIKKSTEIREITKTRSVEEEYTEEKEVKVYILEFTHDDLMQLTAMVRCLDRRNHGDKRASQFMESLKIYEAKLFMESLKKLCHLS